MAKLILLPLKVRVILKSFKDFHEQISGDKWPITWQEQYYSSQIAFEVEKQQILRKLMY